MAQRRSVGLKRVCVFSKYAKGSRRALFTQAWLCVPGEASRGGLPLSYPYYLQVAFGVLGGGEDLPRDYVGRSIPCLLVDASSLTQPLQTLSRRLARSFILCH